MYVSTAFLKRGQGEFTLRFNEWVGSEGNSEDSMLVVTPHLGIPLREFSYQYTRSGGPGGQNVNKVNTKVILRWDVMNSPHLPDDVRARFYARFKRRITNDGVLVLSSQRFRARERNHADCLEKLRQMLLEVAQGRRARRPTKVSRSAREKRLKSKRVQSAKKRDRKRRSPGDED
jgi:ribosome-associated protein